MSAKVLLACNDPRNGIPTGRVSAIQIDIGDEHWEFEHPSERGNALRLLSGFPDQSGLVVIGGCFKFAATHYASWVGNWCWDQVTCSEVHARRLIAFLRRHRKSWDDWLCLEQPA